MGMRRAYACNFHPQMGTIEGSAQRYQCLLSKGERLWGVGFAGKVSLCGAKHRGSARGGAHDLLRVAS